MADRDPFAGVAAAWVESQRWLVQHYRDVDAMLRERGVTEPMPKPERAEVPQHEPVAWAVVGADGEVLDSHIYHTESIARRWADEANDCVAPLYRKPQPALTDDEREAVKLAAEWFASVPLGDTLRALLARL